MNVLEKKISDPILEAQRLDKVLSISFPDLSRMRLQQLIKEGQIFLNGEKATSAKTKVSIPLKVRIVLPEATSYEKVSAQDLALDVVFEDEDILVLNKAAGMVVHPGAGNWDGTLVNALLHHCGDSLSGISGEKRPGIVHRLDKNTSGLMVVAKNDKSHVNLSNQFSNKSLMRAYIAFVMGDPVGLKVSEIFESLMGRHPHHRQKMAVVAHGGKQAITQVYPIKKFYYQKGKKRHVISKIRCVLQTGRTHQIRVHLSHAGFPLLGDNLYQSRANQWVYEYLLEQGLQKDLWQNGRQALHAYRLMFQHPTTQETMVFEKETPKDLQALEDALEKMHKDGAAGET